MCTLCKINGFILRIFTLSEKAPMKKKTNKNKQKETFDLPHTPLSIVQIFCLIDIVPFSLDRPFRKISERDVVRNSDQSLMQELIILRFYLSMAGEMLVRPSTRPSVSRSRTKLRLLAYFRPI